MAEEKKKRGAQKGKAKTQSHVVEGRINVLFKAMISGAVLDTYKLREIAVIHKWDVKDRTLTDYRASAFEKFKELADLDLQREIGIAMARYQFIFNQGVAQKQLRTALRAQKEICQLLGLNAPDKHEVSMSIEQPLFGDGETK